MCWVNKAKLLLLEVNRDFFAGMPRGVAWPLTGLQPLKWKLPSDEAVEVAPFRPGTQQCQVHGGRHMVVNVYRAGLERDFKRVPAFVVGDMSDDARWHWHWGLEG